MQRPSKREIYIKIERSKAAVKKADIFIIEPDVIAEDAIELGYRIRKPKYNFKAAFSRG